MTRWLLLVAALLALPACDGNGKNAAEPSSTTTTTLASIGIETEVPTAPPETQPPATQASATTSTTEDEGPPVVLRGDGLGAHRFGDPVDEVIAGLTLRWGPPNQDSGWLRAGDSPFGVCPGNEVRGVEWTGFRVLFSDGPTPFGPAGRRHFFTWVYLAAGTDTAPRPDLGGNRPPLRTEAGISVAATVADLQRAYGDKLELFDDPEAGGPFFGVTTPNGLLNGGVTSVDPGGIVRSMTGGGGCGE
jgi:hypothetical protein